MGKPWWLHLDLIGDVSYLIILAAGVLGALAACYHVIAHWRCT